MPRSVGLGLAQAVTETPAAERGTWFDMCPGRGAKYQKGGGRVSERASCGPREFEMPHHRDPAWPDRPVTTSRPMPASFENQENGPPESLSKTRVLRETRQIKKVSAESGLNLSQNAFLISASQKVSVRLSFERIYDDQTDKGRPHRVAGQATTPCCGWPRRWWPLSLGRPHHWPILPDGSPL